MLRVPNSDGDARGIHGDLSWLGQRRPYVQRGERVLYFLAPKCLRRGYKLAREGAEPKSLSWVLLLAGTWLLIFPLPPPFVEP
jgi:hypothetical protein